MVLFWACRGAPKIARVWRTRCMWPMPKIQAAIFWQVMLQHAVMTSGDFQQGFRC
jgi:hypothetical protein